MKTFSSVTFRSLGLNTLTAYQRAKVSALNIVNLNRRRKHCGTNTVSNPTAGDLDLDEGQINSISESVNEARSARSGAVGLPPQSRI